MSSREFTLADLVRILREGAGADESADLGGDILGVAFESLGYESLALLETIGRIEREYGIALDDDILASAGTPGELIEAVGGQLALARAN